MIRVKPSILQMDFGNDNDNEEPIILVVDASGLTVSKKGDHIEEKWMRKKKEFIKLHMEGLQLYVQPLSCKVLYHIDV